jgi:hypothetical protein
MIERVKVPYEEEKRWFFKIVPKIVSALASQNLV